MSRDYSERFVGLKGCFVFPPEFKGFSMINPFGAGGEIKWLKGPWFERKAFRKLAPKHKSASDQHHALKGSRPANVTYDFGRQVERKYTSQAVTFKCRLGRLIPFAGVLLCCAQQSLDNCSVRSNRIWRKWPTQDDWSWRKDEMSGTFSDNEWILLRFEG